MPYRRRYKRRRRYRKKRFMSGRWGVAQRALHLARYLKGLINVEFKNLDTANSLTVTTSPSVTHLTAISQGDGQNDRDGYQCRLKSFLYRFHVSTHASAVVTQLRCVIFKWNNQATPSSADIIEGTSDPLTHIKINRHGMFVVLFDRLFNLTNEGKGKGFDSTFYRRINVINQYDAAAGTDFTTGSIWALWLSDQATNSPTVDFNARIRFIDN